MYSGLKLFTSIGRPEYDPTRVGVRDLDPFGEGSGMIFDPFDMRRRPFGGGLGWPSSRGGLGIPGLLPQYAYFMSLLCLCSNILVYVHIAHL